MNDRFSSALSVEEKRLALLRRKRGISQVEATAETGIPIVPADQVVPASFAQQRLWFLDRLAPGNPFYTVSLKMPLDGIVYPDHLKAALTEIARRHAALRTTFAEEDGQPIQIAHTEPKFPMEIIDLSRAPRAQARAALQKISDEETYRSFDLTTGPLAMARLVKLGARQHRLHLTLHHIVCDGWSLKVLGRELTELYVALIEGRAHALPELAVQYRDFAAWQHEAMDGARMETHRAYWSKALADAPELTLPTDFARPAVPTYGGAFVPFTLDRDIADDITALCAEEGVTPFMVLLTVWMILLGRHADMDDILVAAPSAGRERRALEAMIGFFVNTLVLRGDLSGDPSFRDCVLRVRDTCLAAFSHDEYPFDRLIEDLAPARRGDRNPLAQVVFQLFSAPDRSVGQAAPDERQRGTSKFDLRLDLWDTAEGYAAELEYSTDLYEHDTAELMAEQFQVLLMTLLEDSDLPISEASLMSQNEFDWLMEATNQTDAPWPADQAITHVFASMVADHADDPAVIWGGRTLTYQELETHSDGLAADLAAHGIGVGCHVGILLPRSPEMVVAWLGTLKAGAAYVPFDLDTPVARLRGMLDTIEAAALITEWDDAPFDIPTLSPDVDRWADAAPFTARPMVPDEVANIMFTSGSTGTPKAVLVPQQGILRLAVGQEFWDVRPGDRLAQASNCAFDAATMEVWTALLNGATIVGQDRDDLLTPGHLAGRLAAGDFDHMFLTTTLFHKLIEENPAMFAPLRTLLSGGSRMDPDLVRRVVAAGPPERLINAYGPTEITTLGTTWPIDAMEQPLTNVPIGRPLKNTTAYILDRQGRLVPRTQPGELFLGGPGVSLGYLGQPDQTARRFGPSPFRDGERLYATGDRARMRHDGSIDYLGRFDDQKKVRGFRVEPDEIAAALRAHPRVADAQALISDEAGAGDSRIVAFYVPAQDDATGDSLETADEAVAYWQKIYDDVVYQGVGSGQTDAQFDITGWTDSATGDLLSEADMAEQIAQTCDCVRALGGQDILEFGCGTGLIMFPLAPVVRSVHGIDISERALDHVRRTAKASGIDNITVTHGSLEALEALPDDSFDTVVMNSVVQYFPSANYLRALLQDLMRVTRPGGAVLLGDIRHKGLVRAFQAEIAANRSTVETLHDAVADVVDRRVAEEQELLLDPHWFVELSDAVPQIGAVAVQLKRGVRMNELARFRYDAVLHLGEKIAPPKIREITWTAALFAPDAILAEAATPVHISGIPNARTAYAQTVAELLLDAAPTKIGALTKRAHARWPGAVSPEELASALEEKGMHVQLGWGDDLACFDLVVSREPLPPLAMAGARPDEPLANAPAVGRSLRGLEQDLGQFLAQLLPDYMVPQGFVRLSDMPLTPNGKVDKKTLAAALVSSAQAPTRPPQTDLERQLAAIFCAVLQVPHVGLDDDFFRMGGHSLKATQVISRIASDLQVTIPLRTIFDAGTVEGLAAAVEQAQADLAAGRGPSAITAAGDLDIDAMDEPELERALAELEGDAE